MGSVRFQFPQSLDSVYAFVADPEVVRRRSVAFGDTDIQISTTGSTVSNVRKVAAEVPSFAKKFLNPVNTVTDVKRWNPTTKSAELAVDIQGVPVKINGTIRLSASGSGTEYAVDFTVSCKIPLIGGQLEKHITGVTEEGMRKEFEWNKAELSKG